MNAAELRHKSTEALRSELLDLLKEELNLRMQLATGQMSRSHLIRAARRNIARVKTVLKEKAGD